MQKAFFSSAAVIGFTLFVTALSPEAYAAEEPEGKANAPDTTTVAIGIGAQRQPSYLGAATHRTHPIPYLDINWHDQIELSTTDGLVVDLLHQEHWHGGLVGTLIWGRSARDLGALAPYVNTLSNTEQGGLYLEYEFTKSISTGMRWRHDLQGTGAAYGDIYTEFELPAPDPIEHSIKFDAAAMNRSAMNRFFGISPGVAGALGTSAYQPGAGFAGFYATYTLFVPTSKHSGISLAIDWGRLRGAAAQSPLVRDFGSRNQRDLLLTAIYAF